MIRNPKDFGTVGAGDDTAAINAAAGAIRADGYGVLHFDGAQTPSGHARFYETGPLNLTGCSRMEIRIDAGVVLRGSLMTAQNQAAIIDVNGGHEVTIDNDGHIYGGLNDPWSVSPPSVIPLAGILVGGDTDKTLITGQGKVTGFFRSGCIVVVSAVSVKIGGFTQLIQRQGVIPEFGCAPPSLVLTSNPGEWGIKSDFRPLTQGVNAVCNFKYDSGEIHAVNGIGGAGSGWTVYMRGIQVAAFPDVLIGSSRAGHVLFQGTNSDINFPGTCFRNDDASNPVHVFENHGTAVNVRAYGPSPNNLQAACTGTPWAGSFTGASGQF